MAFVPTSGSAVLTQVEPTPIVDDFMKRFEVMHVKPAVLTPVGDKFARLQAGFSDSEVYATANSVFFTTPKMLMAKTSNELPGDDFNRNEFLDGIVNICQANDEMVWYFWLDRACDVLLEVAVLPIAYTSTDSKNKDGKLDPNLVVSIDNSSCVAKFQASPDNHAVVLNVSNLEAGLHRLVLQLDHLFFWRKGIGVLRYVRLTTSQTSQTGQAVVKLARERWRPEALYTSHWSSKVKQIMSSIVDMHVADKMGSYSPILPGWTQYFGNSFNPDGSVDQKGGMNFTMHAAKDGKPLPPINEMPRFVRIGHPTATTSFYSHEGSGVKVAGYDTAFANNTSGRYVYAGRIDNQVYRQTAKGGFHRFFVAWFDEAHVRPDGQLGKWRLFAQGERFRTVVPSAKCNTFNEKVGGRTGERSGHLEMGMDYLTYHAGPDKVFHFGDRMTPSTSLEFANREWSIRNNRFETSAGGILCSKQSRKALVLAPPAEQPNYIKFASDLDQFGEEYPDLELFDRQGQQIQLQVYLPAELDAESCVLDVFSGTEDHLTFTTRWPNKQTFAVDSQGAKLVPGSSARVLLDNAGQTMLRLCARDANMQIFSLQTFTILAKSKRVESTNDDAKRTKLDQSEDQDQDQDQDQDYWL